MAAEFIYLLGLDDCPTDKTCLQVANSNKIELENHQNIQKIDRVPQGLTRSAKASRVRASKISGLFLQDLRSHSGEESDIQGMQSVENKIGDKI